MKKELCNHRFIWAEVSVHENVGRALARCVTCGEPVSDEVEMVEQAATLTLHGPTTLLHRTLKRRADQHVPEAEETARMFGKKA